MECKQCSDNLTAFLDKELSSAESEQIESHLRICKSCAEEHRSLHRTVEFLLERNNELSPSDFSWNLLAAKIAQAEPERHRSLFNPLLAFRWRAATAALALFAIIALGYFHYQRHENKLLQDYMSQYVKDREEQMKMQPILFGIDGKEQIESPYANNPFIEVKSTAMDNPFHPEGK